MVTDKLENIRFQIKEDLSKVVVTRDMFEERFNLVDEKFNVINERFNTVDEKIISLRTELKTEFNEKFKHLNFKFNILIALTLAALTLANPAFMELLKRLF